MSDLTANFTAKASEKCFHSRYFEDYSVGDEIVHSVPRTINSGRHAAPSFAGNTIYAWSEILDRMDIPGRGDVGALRLRTLASKDDQEARYPDRNSKEFPENIVLDLDYTVLIPRR